MAAKRFIPSSQILNRFSGILNGRISGRYFLLVFFIVLYNYEASGQDNQLYQATRDRLNYNEFKPNTGYYIYGMEGKKGELRGDYYLDSTWHKGKLQFYQHTVVVSGKIIKLDTLSDVPLRFDLKNNEVEIKSNQGIKSVLGERVQSFTLEENLLTRATFINVREFKGKASELKGFFEVLSDGDLKLLAYTRLWIKTPTYVPALDVGSKDTQIMKERHYYFAKETEVNKLAAGKSGLLKLMQDKKEQMNAFLNSHDLELKNPHDLALVFKHYNSLP